MKATPNNTAKACLAVLLSAALSACGGGSGTPAATTVTPAVAPASITGVVGGTSAAPTIAGAALTSPGSITVNGKTGNSADLQPGSVIRVVVSSVTAASSTSTAPAATGGGSTTASASATRVSATSTDVRIEIEGAIAAVNTAASTLTVLGQTVTVDALTNIESHNRDGTYTSLTLADLAAGDYVEASGTRQPNGSLLASRIERQTLRAGDPGFNSVELHGSVAALDTTARTFTIGTTTVSYGTATVSGTLANGARVEVEGTVSGSTITASRVQVRPLTEPAGNRVEVEGAISATDTVARRFDVQGLHVDYATATVSGTIADGARADVEGTVDLVDPTLIHATSVEIGHRNGGSGKANREVKGTLTAVDTTALTLDIGSNGFFADTATIVERDDAPATFASLAVGTRVEIKADSTRTQGTRLYATKIEIKAAPGATPPAGEFEVKAAITSFDATARTITVSGVLVSTTASTTYWSRDTQLTADQFFGTSRLNRVVEVKGTQTGTAAATATRIELED